jgi:ABC-type antimicrobial peptide transport system permease subunit
VAVLVPFIGLLSLTTVALLAFLNVKERIYELGLLLSIGVKTSKILTAFLLKACCSAIVGAVLGITLFYLCVDAGNDKFFSSYGADLLIHKSKLLLALLAMPLLAVLATWLPALWAAQTDPAEVLRND